MPRFFRAPGRVNLIGEHTDYNDGFVMPAAIDFSVWVTVGPFAGRKLKIVSEHFPGEVEFDLDEKHPRASGHWSDYVIGVAVTLESSGIQLQGATLSFRSSIPIGSGLSSSAAVEVATACALTANANVEVDRTKLALLCRQSENDFVGARVGIMDQFASLYGKSDKALLLDCRSLDYQLLPLSGDYRLVVCNTMVKHSLAAGEYNQRRAECEDGVKTLSARLPHVKALRDVTLQELEEFGQELPEVVFRRCRHVVTENARVLEAGDALTDGDLAKFGRLMNESHESLRHDYEVSCPELDLMVKLAGRVEGVYGARMTGGGFGGCTVNLVENESVQEFRQTVISGYQEATGIVPEIYICDTADGAHEVSSIDAQS